MKKSKKARRVVLLGEGYAWPSDDGADMSLRTFNPSVPGMPEKAKWYVTRLKNRRLVEGKRIRLYAEVI